MSANLQATINVDANQIPASILKNAAEILRTQMAQVAFAETPIRLSELKVWNAMATNLPAAAADDDLGLTTGTPGTNSLQVDAGDVKTLNSSRKAAFELIVPDNYDDGQSFELRLRAAMETNVADTSCTIDVEAWKPNGSGGVGSDLVITSAQDMNSLTPADFDFAIDASNLDPGDKLEVVVTIAYNDSATGTAVTPVIYDITRRCDVRG